MIRECVIPREEVFVMWDEHYKNGYNKGRADAIIECMQIVKDYSSALVGTYYYNLFIEKMEQLKEK